MKHPFGPLHPPSVPASCTAASESVTTPIRIVWTSAVSFTVLAPGVGLEWRVRLASTPAMWLLNGLAGRLPPGAETGARVLAAVGRTAGRMLGAGPLRLAGRTPNGHQFRLAPRRWWTVCESVARLEGRELGHAVHGRETVRLGDFRLPTRGVFAFAQAHFAAPWTPRATG